MNLFLRFILFIFYFDLGIMYFFNNIIYLNYIQFKLALINKINLSQLYSNLNNFNYTYIKNEFLYFEKYSRLLAPSLNVYYPIKSSIYSITLRITGVFIMLIVFVLLFVFIFFDYFIIILLLIIL